MSSIFRTVSVILATSIVVILLIPTLYNIDLLKKDVCGDNYSIIPGQNVICLDDFNGYTPTEI